MDEMLVFETIAEMIGTICSERRHFADNRIRDHPRTGASGIDACKADVADEGEWDS